MHISRLKNGNCSVDSGIAFIEILNCCDSIFNYCLNICIAVNHYAIRKDIATKHDYRKEFYDNNQIYIHTKFKEYRKLYK